MYRTQDNHMPKSHSEWKKARGYNAAWFLGKADKIGTATRWAIGHVLVSRIHEAQSYNSCMGILQLGKKYSDQRLEAACMRCQKVGKTSYSMLKRILHHNIDMAPEEPEVFNMPEHDNIRGPQAYK